MLVLAERHRAAEQREDRLDGPAAGQKKQKVAGEGSAAGEPVPLGADAPPAPQEWLTWHMVPKVAGAQRASVASLRIEDIVTIEDAALFARGNASHMPGELLRRVWRVRGN